MIDNENGNAAPQCNNPEHKGFEIYALCLKLDCKYNSAQCCKCTIKLHKACVSSTKQLEDIPDLLKPFEQFKNQLGILQARCNRSRLLYQIEKILQPIEKYEESPNNTSLNNLGKFLKESGKMQEQLEILFNKQKEQIDIKKKSKDTIQEKHLIDADNLFDLGRVVEQQKKYLEAFKYYEKAVILDPNFCEAWNNKGFITYKFVGLALLNLEKYEEAIECYDKALNIDSEFVYALNGKGEALFQLNKIQEAIHCYDLALNIDPNYREAWNNKGVALDQNKQYQEAIICFEKAININRKFIEAWNGLGNTLLHLYKYEKSIDCFENILKLDPKFHYAWNGLGEALRIQAKYGDAIDCYENALKIDPEYTFAKQNLERAKYDLSQPIPHITYEYY